MYEAEAHFVRWEHGAEVHSPDKQAVAQNCLKEAVVLGKMGREESAGEGWMMTLGIPLGTKKGCRWRMKRAEKESPPLEGRSNPRRAW